MSGSFKIVSIDCIPIGIVESMTGTRDLQTQIQLTVTPVTNKALGRYILLNNRTEREPIDFPVDPVVNLEHMSTGRPVLWLGWLSKQFEGWALR